MRFQSFLFLIFGWSLVMASCKGCESIEDEKGESSFSARIETDKISYSGSVYMSSSNQPKMGSVLKIAGSIKDNQLKGANKLCTIIIPDNIAIKDAAQELTSISDEPSEKGEAIVLQQSQGYAYYGDPITAGYYGNLEHAIYVKELDANKSYQAYLGAVSDESARWVVYSEQGVVVNADLLTIVNSQTIRMTDAKPGRNVTQTPSPVTISLEAKVDGKRKDFDGGFLLVKHGENSKNPGELFFNLIQKNIQLTPGSSLTKVDGYEDVLFLTDLTPNDFKAQTGDINSVTSNYEDGLGISPADPRLLQRGAHYDVYFYVVDANSNYQVSEAKSFQVPVVEAELEMLEVDIVNLVAGMGKDEADQLSLKLKGKINKQEGTTKPYFGFLLVKDVHMNNADAIQKINDLTNSPIQDADKGSLRNENKDYLVYVVNGNIGLNNINEHGILDLDLIDKGANLELGSEYYVYCWLKDGGDVFVSKNENKDKIEKLALPKVEDSRITDITTGRNWKANNALIIYIDHALGARHNFLLSDRYEWGYLSIKTSIVPANPADFGTILQELQNYDNLIADAQRRKNEGQNITVPDRKAILTRPIDGSNKAFDKMFTDELPRNISMRFGESHAPLEPGGREYSMYMWAREGNTIFYSDVAGKTFRTKTDIQKTDRLESLNANEVVNPDPAKYQFTSYLINHTARLISGIKERTTTELTKQDDERLIRRVLEAIIDIQGVIKQQEIDDFVDNYGITTNP